MADTPQKKSPHAEREEKVLGMWNEKGIFEKSLAKGADGKAPKGEYIFYEGPPGANGRPHIGHLEARAFKDAIPRYKTMQGFHVRRKGGWDTHGLPVELQVEKQLGFKVKKEIEAYGIAAFNEKCKESVWTYVHEWENFTKRLGYWVDLKDPYVTYKPDYIESVWNIMQKVDHDGHLYKDYKVLPWCPRCGTALSSHELAQGYEDVKDLTVTVKFEIRNLKSETNPKSENQNKKYLLAWTTTPWTLPGNVALAVGTKVEYVEVQIEKTDETFILAKERLSILKDEKYTVKNTHKGSDLVGLEYEPLYPFLKDAVTGAEKDKLKNAFKVYAGDFVTTTEGTGIVHIAPMYGQDDFELGTKNDLPKHHLVNDDGTFMKEVGFLAGKFVKAREGGEDEVAIEIVKDLAHRGLLFAKEKHEHNYPHCWRCHTPLIYFARDSWYIRMSALRDKLVKENEGIHWEPEHIKEGRFGEWLREVKDWAISRERYWGAPLPVWICETCKKRKVVGSVAEIAQKPRNTYYVIRHGEADSNVENVWTSKPDAPYHLTEKGKAQVKKSAQELKHMHFDVVLCSPMLRTRETADILMKELNIPKEVLKIDNRIHELESGVLEGTSHDLYDGADVIDRFPFGPEKGENYSDVKKRMGSFIYEVDTEYEGKNILIVSHETPLFLLMAAASGLDREACGPFRANGGFLNNADHLKLDFSILPHNDEYELDLHRPYIDEVKLACSCGGTMSRVKEVMDVWFDSGAMPFAQDHYPFEKNSDFNPKGGLLHKAHGYPADFICEAIDQTRGWFYTLHAVGVLMGVGKAYKNVICLGHILDAKGKKMSKSLGNVVDPFAMMNTYGADALRFWMYSVNQPGDAKNFDLKTVDEVNKKVFNLTSNVLSFYQLYADNKNEIRNPKSETSTKSEIPNSKHVLDLWIISRLNELIETVTKGLDNYTFLEPTRAIRDFVADLSQWYLRRSRDRFKGDDATDKTAALATTRYVLITLAKVLAPFTPFFAEFLYQEVGGDLESVHLEGWAEAGKVDPHVLSGMNAVRRIASRGLEARMTAKVNVRQPLKSLKFRENSDLSKDFIELIKDEVNVKEVSEDVLLLTDVELDTTITPELKEEGDLRELLRKIQDMRKENGLTVNDKAVLVATDEFKGLVGKFENDIKSVTNLSKIEFGVVFDVRK